MWFSIISALIFLALTTILFTPEFRKFPVYKSLSFFFLFEGAYAVSNFIATEIWGIVIFMPTIHDIGCIILGLYVLITASNYKKRIKLLEKESNTIADIQTSKTNTELKPVDENKTDTAKLEDKIEKSNTPTASASKTTKTTSKKTTSTSKSKTSSTRSKTTKSTTAKKTSKSATKGTKTNSTAKKSTNTATQKSNQTNESENK